MKQLQLKSAVIKFQSLTIAIIFCVMNLNAQTNLLNSTYKYFLGSVPPPENWAHTDFIDSTWHQAEGAIGYGEKIHQTNIDTTLSLYVRYKFNITDSDLIDLEALTADIFFDDGFVAYINGNEFARSNLGVKGEFIPNNKFTERSHESRLAATEEYPVAGYYIDSNFIKNQIKIGENILAIQVHNDSLQGSDLSLWCTLSPIYPSLVNDDSFAFMNWLRTKSYVELDSTKLPIVIIESNEYGIPYSHVDVIANMKIIDNKNRIFNKPTDTVFEYNGRIKTEVRGSSSSLFPKRSYNIETQNVDGSNNNVQLLGMPEENDWILYAPFADKSCLQNKIAFKLGELQGNYEPRMEFCELILNGEYQGMYVLMEKIKPDKNRVNISKLTENDTDGDEVTGGYIFYTDTKDKMRVYYPKESKIQPEQESYISEYINRYKSLLYSNDWLDVDKGYRKYIDTESLLDFVIINELTMCLDKYIKSTYMYKNRSDKDSLIRFGPHWDFNFAFGNIDMYNERWVFEFNDMGLQRYFQDTTLVNQFRIRWYNQRKQFLHTDSLFSLIDSLAIYIEEARVRNYKVWHYMDKEILIRGNASPSYEACILKMKQAIKKRAEWIDQNITNLYYPLVTYTNDVSNEIRVKYMMGYPNPFYNQISVELFVQKEGNYMFEMIDINGKTIKQQANYLNMGKNATVLQNLEFIPLGTYLLKCKLNNVNICSVKIVKTN